MTLGSSSDTCLGFSQLDVVDKAMQGEEVIVVQSVACITVVYFANGHD